MIIVHYWLISYSRNYSQYSIIITITYYNYYHYTNGYSGGSFPAGWNSKPHRGELPDWRLQSAGAQAVGGYSPSGFGPENNIGIVGSFKHDIISSYIIIIFYLGLMCFFSLSLSVYDSARFCRGQEFGSRACGEDKRVIDVVRSCYCRSLCRANHLSWNARPG